MRTITKFILSTLTLMLMAVQGAWADVKVWKESDLREAVKTSQTVTLIDDIWIHDRLDIDGKTVTLDLNGYKLQRYEMAAADDDGQVIAVMNNGKLTITDSETGGEIAGGRAYQGGGIYVYEGCSLTIEDGTITGNRADKKGDGYGFGGAIENHGTMTMTGGYIGNNAGSFGGGIYNAGGATLTMAGGSIYENTATVGGGIYNAEGGTLTLTSGFIIDNTASSGGGIYHVGGTLNMQGKPVVYDNGSDDVCLASGQIITVTGAFIMGANIGVSASVQGIFTSGYSTYNTATPDTYFFVNSSDLEYVVALSNGEASIKEAFDYVERTWDDNAKTVKETIKTCSDYTRINGTDTSDETGWLPLYDGWYVVTGNSSYKTLNVMGEDVHLIILDDVSLTVSHGVRLMAGHKLTIYSQDDDTGQLIVTNGYSGAAGIGSATENGVEKASGELVIHGGIVSATGGRLGAGIGSGAKSIAEDTDLCGPVTIYGGTVTATGGEDGAGIGGGAGYEEHGNHGGKFILYGGKVTAQGGNEAAGVGGGGGYDPSVYSSSWGGKGGRVEVYGGELNATGGSKGAGIGSGEQLSPDSPDAASVHIYGGKVTANGGDDGAGIGGGQKGGGAYVEVSGGEVYATGGNNAAGIGGGDESRGGTFKITDGIVVAKGGPGAAGIGGGDGDYGLGGKNYILGGLVAAEAGTQGGTGNRAFGPGDNIAWEDDGNFYLELGNEMRVCAGMEGAHNAQWFSSSERIDACKYRSYARVELCPHQESTTYDIELEQHKGNCYYCNLQEGGSHVLVNGKCTECGCVILNDNEDNSSILSRNDGAACPAVFLKDRYIWKNGSWNTICLPFNVEDGDDTDDITFSGTPLAGAMVKTISSASLTNGILELNFSDASTIEAGKPYIVKWENTTLNTESPKFENVTLTNDHNDIEAAVTEDGAGSTVTFRGLFSPYAIQGENHSLLYLGADNTLYYPNRKMTIGAFRAYFELNGLTAGEPGSGINSFVLNFGDEYTGISLTPDPSLKGEGSDYWYSLDGRRLGGKPTQKGIYINNGHQVVIK